MVDQMTLQTMGILLTGLTVSIAAIYYTLTLRYTRRNQDLQLETRQAQVFMGIYEHFYGKEFLNDYVQVEYILEMENPEEFVMKYGPQGEMDVGVDVVSMLAYFEGIGIMVRRGLIDPRFVYELLGGWILVVWRRTEPIVQYYRDVLQEIPEFRVWENFEFLAEEMQSQIDQRSSTETLR